MAYKGPFEIPGPATSTDTAISRFDGTSSTFIQDSIVTISATDVLSGAAQFNVDNLRLDGNTISSTDTNGNVIFSPDGTGIVSVTDAAVVPNGDRAESIGSTSNSWNNLYTNQITFDDGTNNLANFVDSTSFTPSVEFGGGTTGITYCRS